MRYLILIALLTGCGSEEKSLDSATPNQDKVIESNEIIDKGMILDGDYKLVSAGFMVEDEEYEYILFGSGLFENWTYQSNGEYQTTQDGFNDLYFGNDYIGSVGCDNHTFGIDLDPNGLVVDRWIIDDGCLVTEVGTSNNVTHIDTYYIVDPEGFTKIVLNIVNGYEVYYGYGYLKI